MANGGQIRYSVGFDVDKTGLNQIRSSLQEIKNLTAQDLMRIGGHDDLQRAKTELDSLKASVATIDDAFKKAFNTDLGTLNVAKFNQSLKNLNLNKIYQDFSKAGAAGQTAFRNMTSQILTTNMQLKQTNNFINNMATTMANTIKWGVASSVMNSFTGSVRKAYGYVKNLDTSLNDIRIVTGASADEMERFATKANNAAKELGKSTTDYTEAALIYYQQGLGDEEVEARAETTLKAANVTGQSGQEVSEQLTAVWNGYKVSASEAELYVDKLAAVAATTASNLEELSTGMSKVASAANLMGVDVDSLNAQISTIIAVTRQAPESVGTALKTIYARMGDIEAGLDGEVSLDMYTSKMAEMGINVLDTNGKLRDMGGVIEEIGGKWQSMSREQQLALSQTMAGTRQYNNLLALFDNWDNYTKALETSRNAAGTLQEQQDTYMESTRAHLNQLRAASEDLYDSLLDPKGLNPLIDGLTVITNLFSNFIDSIGGGGGLLLALGSIGTKVFSHQLASGIATFITNMQNAKDNAAQLRAELEIVAQIDTSRLNNDQITSLIEMKKRVLDLNKSITNEERNIANEYIKQQNILYQQQDDLQNRLAQAKELYSQISGTSSKQMQNTSNTEMANSLRSAATQLEPYKRGIKETEDAYRSFVNISKEASQVTEEYRDKLYNAKDTIQANVESASNLVREFDLETTSRERLVKAIEKYNQATKKGKDIDLKNIAVTEAAREVREAYAQALDKTQHKLRSSAADLENHAKAMRENAKSSAELQNSYNGFVSGINLRAVTEQSIKLVSSFGQLASAITSVSRIGSIWSNEDLTTGEKLLQTTTSLGFALPMLSNSLGLINKTLGIGTSITTAYTAAQMASKISAEAVTAITAKGIALEQAKKIALLQTLGTEKAKIGVERIISMLSKGRVSQEKAEIVINKLLAESNIEVGNSSIFAGQGIKTFLGSLGPIGWIFIAVTAISALAAAFAHFHVSAKEAGEAVEDSLSALNDETSKLDNLKNKLQEVDDALTALYSKEDLSFTDEQDIANLQKERAELETQLEIQEGINEAKKQALLLDTKTALQKGTYDYDGKQTIEDMAGKTSVIDVTSESTKQDWIDGQVEQYGEHVRKAAEEKAQEVWDTYHDEVTTPMVEDLDSIITQLENAEELGDDETANQLKDKIAEIYDATGILEKTVTSSVDNAFDGNTDAIKNVRDKINANTRPETGWNEGSLTTVGSGAGLTSEEFELISQAANNANLSVDQFVQTLSKMEDVEIPGTIEHALNKMKTALMDQGLEQGQAVNYKNHMNNVLQDFRSAGFDDSILSEAVANINWDAINWEDVDYTNFEELMVAHMNDAIATTMEQNTDSFTEDVQEKGKNYSEKYDIDAEVYEDLTKLLHASADAYEGFSDEIVDNEEAAMDAAKALLRYDKALESVQENSEKWMKILKSDNAMDHAQIIDELADAYGNLFDIDGSALSGEFLTSTENLELMQQAAKGSEEAYNSLQEIAGKDILAQVGINTDQYAKDLAEIEGMAVNAEKAKLADVEAGASLDDRNFISSLENMVNAAGMTASQAEAYLGSMGVDAEVEEATKTVQEVVGHNAIPYTFLKRQAYDPGSDPDGSTSPSIATYPEVMYRTTPVTVPKKVSATGIRIKSAKKSSGGAVKFKNSSHGGGASAPKKSGGGGGGGGRGGGSTKKATKSKLDKNKKTIDRYHDINNELSKLSTTMDRLADAQDKLFGRELYDNLNKQLKILNKQIAASKEKLEIAKEERKELQDQLEDKGFTFDIDGDISNYTEKLEEYKKEIDDKITKYNNMSAKKQNKKAGKNLKEEIEKLQEEYEEIEELIKNYDTLLIDTIPELEDEVTQFARQKVEIEVEKFKIEAELRLEISEAVRDWNDFKKEIFKDSENVADAILDTVQNGLINSGSLAKDTQDLNTINKAIADIKAGERTTESEQYLLTDDEGNILYDKNGNYQFDMRKALDTQKDYMDRVKNAVSSFYDDMDEMYDNYLESVETAIESTENYQDALETVSDVLEHTMNMITAINGEDAFDEIGKVIEKQLDATTNMIKSAQDEIARISGPQFDKDGNELPSRLNQAKAELDGLTKEIAEKEAQIANMGEGADKTQAQIELETMKRMAEAKKNEIEAYQEALNSNQELLRESLEEYVDLLTQQYENMIAQANKSFENFMSGGLGREGMDREWQNAIAEEDKYLDAVNAAYELRSLENKINDSINATDSLAAQRKLNQFKEEELKKLREKDKLTKYEVERANQLYEIELKKIALEEAQNNKAQMRLRRDSSGNYSYQFVADQESVNKAQQELDTAMNDLYNMDKEEYRSRLEEVSQVEQDFEDFRMWYSEQSAEYRAENEKWYLEQCESYQKQLTDSSNIAAEARNNTIDSANKAMGESFNQVVMESMLPTWDTAMADMVDRVNNPDSGFKAAATSAMNSVVDASKALAEALKELNSLLGLSDGGLADVTSSYYTAAEQGAKDYATAQQANIDNTWKEVDAVKALVDEFEKLAKAKETAGLLAGGVGAVEQGTNTGNNIRETDADSIATNPETPDDPVPETTMVATLTTTRKKKIAANILYGGSRNDWGPDDSDQQRNLLEEVFGPEQAKEILDFVAEKKGEDKTKSSSLYQYYTNKTKKKTKDDNYLTYAEAKDYKKNKEVLAFDTGGYTGNWDDNSGRVAVLHKKELVLNAKDTENLLKTIDIVRKITEDAINGKANKDKTDLENKINTLLQSVVDISKSLAPMLQTDKWNNLQDEVKQKSLNALTEQLIKLGTNLQEFKGADFLVALDHLNNTKDNLQSLMQTNQSQLLLNLDNAEQELALLEKLNQSMINDVASIIQTQTEKISNNEANQEQILMRMLEEAIKSAERDSDIQQTVEIHADFPNATNTDEIQKAFENLVNAASQHAFINKR